MPPQKEDAALAAAAAAFARELSPAEAAGILKFCRLVMTWNQHINLTGAGSVQELLASHIPDSFALSALVPGGVSLVDVGSGGGLPALPFAVLRPDVALTLVEPRAKRAAFLRTATRELGLAAEVRGCRAEDLPGGGFDVASSRATFPPRRWLEEGRRLVLPGGRVVLFLAEGAETDLAPERPQHRLEYEAGGRRRTVAAFDVPRGTE